MSKKKREEAARLASLSQKVDRWLKGYQKSSLLLMAIGVVSFLTAILQAAGFLNNTFGSLGIAYYIRSLLLPLSLDAIWLTLLCLLVNFLLMGVFAFTAIFAAKGNAWAMYLGIALYTADGVFLLILGGISGYEEYLPMLLMHLPLLLGLGITVFYYYKADYYWREYQKAEKASKTLP